jgi:hypothetical protein
MHDLYKDGINVLPVYPKELSKKFLELAKDKELGRNSSFQIFNSFLEL